MRIREAELRDATAMARVSVDSYRAAHRDYIPEQSLMQFTYEESERNWARALRQLSASAEREEYIYVAENDSLLKNSEKQVERRSARVRVEMTVVLHTVARRCKSASSRS